MGPVSWQRRIEQAEPWASGGGRIRDCGRNKTHGMPVRFPVMERFFGFRETSQHLLAVFIKES